MSLSVLAECLFVVQSKQHTMQGCIKVHLLTFHQRENYNAQIHPTKLLEAMATGVRYVTGQKWTRRMGGDGSITGWVTSCWYGYLPSK